MKPRYESRILGTIDAAEVRIGQGVTIEEGVQITGKDGPARLVVVGDFVFIGRETRIMTPEFRIGDYSKLHSFSFVHGVNPMQIGRNCWIGGNCVLDCMGGLDLDDNVGIGAHSQLWTHIQFGDIVEGSRFYSRRYMHVGKDAWFVGHCIVSPVHVGEKSMAMVGSVITKDMLPNHIYAGVPAQDMSHRLGYQFEERTIDEKAAVLQSLVDAFLAKKPQFDGQLKVIRSADERVDGLTCLDVSTRTYTRTYSQAEVEFFREHVPLVKFTPDNEAPFVVPKTTLV